MERADQVPVIEAKRHDPRYQRLMEATRAAAHGGYDAVSMRDLARSCQMSMKTIYRFCGSKDQLIAEAHLDGMVEFRRRVAARPQTGATARDRVGSVMRSFANALDDDEVRSRVMLRALYALDLDASELRSEVGASFSTIVDAAIADADVADREAVIATLTHVMDSVIRIWLAGRHDGAWVRHQLDDAVRVVLGP